MQHRAISILFSILLCLFLNNISYSLDLLQMAREEINEAHGLIEKKEWKQAEKKLNSAVEKLKDVIQSSKDHDDKRLIVANYFLGVIYSDYFGKYSKGLEYFNQALNMNTKAGNQKMENILKDRINDTKVLIARENSKSMNSDRRSSPEIDHAGVKADDYYKDQAAVDDGENQALVGQKVSPKKRFLPELNAKSAIFIAVILLYGIFIWFRTKKKYGNVSATRYLLVFITTVFVAMWWIIKQWADEKDNSKKSMDKSPAHSKEISGNDDHGLRYYPNLKQCATCTYWTGSRELTAIFDAVIIKSKQNMGTCTCKSSHSFKLKLPATNKCSSYEKWNAIR